MNTEIKIELKYCERCGGLWLRRVGSHQAYCATCAPIMRQVATGRRDLSASVQWTGPVEARGGEACA